MTVTPIGNGYAGEPVPEGYVSCPDCGRPVLDALFGAHQRRHNGVSWFDERRPVIAPRPGLGNRNRRDRTPDGGEGRPQRRWQRPRPGAHHVIDAPGRPD